VKFCSKLLTSPGVAEPGLNWKSPIFDSVAGIVSLRVNQITLSMETKTRDNVFVTIPISVQNRVRPEMYRLYFSLPPPVHFRSIFQVSYDLSVAI
jgi:regulator of protease activity HflC (stomatin/prohibitin superfamily)